MIRFLLIHDDGLQRTIQWYCLGILRFFGTFFLPLKIIIGGSLLPVAVALKWTVNPIFSLLIGVIGVIGTVFDPLKSSVNPAIGSYWNLVWPQFPIRLAGILRFCFKIFKSFWIFCSCANDSYFLDAWHFELVVQARDIILFRSLKRRIHPWLALNFFIFSLCAISIAY